MTKQAEFVERCNAVGLGEGSLFTWLEKVESLQSRIAELEAAHAAAVLSNVQLREALQTFIDEHEECQDADDWMAMMCSVEAHHVADEALATPISTEALDKYVAEKVKEAMK